MNRGFRNLGLGATAATATYFIDSEYFGSGIRRSLLTASTAIRVAILYKFEWSTGDFEAVHSKAARLVFDSCVANSGLYIKFGQQIASIASVLPPEWQRFKQLYDDAPPVPFKDIARQIKREFGKDVQDLFDNFEESPRASASIAQVHRATLKGTSIPVAVKVQKPEVIKQVETDLLAFSLVLHTVERVFDLKLTWMLPTILSHLRQELDFVNEAKNSEKCINSFNEIPEFKDKVHVPTVYWDLTTPRVMTTEWIDGTAFTHTEEISKRWGQDKVTTMVSTLVDLFNDQIFRTGFVHCDPHPGNLLIRPTPNNPKFPQIVVLDHGLYTQCSESFLTEYRDLWVNLFSHDIEKVEAVVNKWGIRDVQLIAMAILQRPWSKSTGLETKNILQDVLQAPPERDPITGKLSQEQKLDVQRKMKERLQQYLTNSDSIPRELIFIGRNLNIIRSNNKLYGSPVNRINLMGAYAIKIADEMKYSALAKKPFHLTTFLRDPLPTLSALTHQLRVYSTMTLFSLGFYATRLWNTMCDAYQGVLIMIGVGKPVAKVGFEEVIEEAVRRQVYEQTGVLLDKDAFDA
ncbi:hypothetical protein HDU79_000126 [Rhizoclosmatium sp. JEL0117]|nr:hypothetical protein HDU79_000126 [Rhizoclosmatium sp. JEL0117]